MNNLMLDKVSEFIKLNGNLDVKSCNEKLINLINEVENLRSKKSDLNIFSEDGKILAKLDYYFKKFILVKSEYLDKLGIEGVEFGRKLSSKDGLNSMCNIGCNLWTKRYKKILAIKDDIFEGAKKGEIVKDLVQNMEKLKNSVEDISKYNFKHVFESREECIKFLESKKIVVKVI